jgi:hypothetical protein
MADAPEKWKVEFLRKVIAAPGPVTYPVVHESQEWHWFLDMKRDGYINGEPETTKLPPVNVVLLGPITPDCFVNVVATKEGKKLVEIYDSKMRLSGILKKWSFPVLQWILIGVAGIALYLLSQYLVAKYGIK